MDKFNTLASPNCRNFVSCSKRFVRSEMGMMDSNWFSKIIQYSSTSMIVDSWENPKTKYLSSKCQ